jgi:hypothetical protein
MFEARDGHFAKAIMEKIAAFSLAEKTKLAAKVRAKQ